MWFLLLWAIGLAGAGVSFLIGGVPATSSGVYQTILLYQFVLTFGLLGMIGFIVNIPLGKATAAKLNWPGGQFQMKYGFSQLGLGVMGVLAIWIHGSFWGAVIVSMYIYGVSGLWSHIGLMIEEKKLDWVHISNIIMCIAYQAFLTYLSFQIDGVW